MKERSSFLSSSSISAAAWSFLVGCRKKSQTLKQMEGWGRSSLVAFQRRLTWLTLIRTFSSSSTVITPSLIMWSMRSCGLMSCSSWWRKRSRLLRVRSCSAISAEVTDHSDAKNPPEKNLFIFKNRDEKTDQQQHRFCTLLNYTQQNISHIIIVCLAPKVDQTFG